MYVTARYYPLIQITGHMKGNGVVLSHPKVLKNIVKQNVYEWAILVA